MQKRTADGRRRTADGSCVAVISCRFNGLQMGGKLNDERRVRCTETHKSKTKKKKTKLKQQQQILNILH